VGWRGREACEKVGVGAVSQGERIHVTRMYESCDTYGCVMSKG